MIIDNQTKLQEDFQFIFTAISTLGQNMTEMIDCSDVIPAPAPVNFGATRFPAGKTIKDVEAAVSIPKEMPFPTCAHFDLLVCRDPFPESRYGPWPRDLRG